MGMDAIISLPGLATTAITGTLTLTKTGATPQTATFPDASIEVQATHEVQSSNWQARNHGLYTAIASATVTDPSTPAAGHEFTTLVRNGTLTTSRGTYSVAGTLVQSVWHSGSWTDYPYPHLNGAWTWTAAQTIDKGTGALPAATNATRLVLTLATSDGQGPNIEGFSFNGGSALTLRPRLAGGTRSAPSAVAADQAIFALSCNVYDGTAWNTNNANLTIYTDGLQSISNRGTYWVFQGTSNGSTAAAEWMRLQNGNLGIGVTPTAGNGLLQLASGTTKANGIAFGTDTFLYRGGAGILRLEATNPVHSIYNGTILLESYIAGSVGYFGTTTNHPFNLRTNNTDAINIDISQGVKTNAANYVKTRSVTSAASTTTLDATDDTAILTGSTTHTFTLPAASVGRRLFVKNRSSGALTVNRAGSDTIDGGTTVNIAAGAGKILIVNGTDWCVWNA